jgi:alpha-beta hydrolase superfamily lysophospholipase
MERVQDILGDGFLRQDLGPFDLDGEACVATLVSKACPAGSRKAVLYLHGYVDYFFQVHLANRFLEAGYNFYALDLHRCGRSLKAGQIPHYCRDVAEYGAEITAALNVIRQVDGNALVIGNFHSTGGPIGLLYAQDHEAERPFDGLILNSPFLDFNDSWINEAVLIKVIASLGLFYPEQALPGGLSAVYGESVHRNFHGEWDFDLSWKPVAGFAARAGWVRAIHQAHRRIQAGLSLSCPILCLFSSASSSPKVFEEIAHRSDTVLNVNDIDRYSTTLGSRVTKHVIQNGMHDLVLSREPVRAEVFAAMFAWLDAPCEVGLPIP